MKRISGDTGKGIYTLHGESSCYSLLLYHRRYPLHLHWGGPCAPGGDLWSEPEPPLREHPYAINPDPEDPHFFPEYQQFEYGWSGEGDFRRPAFSVTDAEGFPVTGPFTLEAEILWRKPSLPGLPEVRCGGDELTETLEITMGDPLSGLEVVLRYTPLPAYDAVVRSTLLRNGGSAPLTLDRAMSCSLDLPWDGRQLLSLPGSWARERHPQRVTLSRGTYSFGSTRGISSHQFNPFFALLSPETGEQQGEARGFALVYSGSFLAEAQRNQDDNLRLNLGIHPETFRWHLPPGESFSTPEAVMVYSPEGLGGLSERCHRLIGERILPPRFREKERPVLVNNWEATYFDFDEEKLCGLADSAAELGAELFVLDDGWFGERDSADKSLGDWQVNRRKLPGGLEGLAEHVRSRGMEFGLWVEPEMISRESELYRRRPDWCLHIPGRRPPEGRSQLVLDLTRREVREHLIGVLIGLLDAAPVSYVKWDMNRPLAGASSPTLPARHRGEVHHRYLLGLYEVLEKVTAARPEVLFEGCAGGGGRFDMGMLYYMPQYWSSDNTDAVSRLTIQYGTSILYPPVTMSAHVSAVPNHQTGRTVPLSFRGNAAMSGNLGYELDPATLTPAERLEVQEQIAFYTRHRRLIQFGRFIRLAGPAEHGETAWMFVDEDQREALVFRFIIRREANEPLRRLPLAGLDPDAVYADQDSGRRCRGDELMHRGLHPPAEPAEPTESAGEYLSLRIFLQAE